MAERLTRRDLVRLLGLSGVAGVASAGTATGEEGGGSPVAETVDPAIWRVEDADELERLDLSEEALVLVINGPQRGIHYYDGRS